MTGVQTCALPILYVPRPSQMWLTLEQINGGGGDKKMGIGSTVGWWIVVYTFVNIVLMIIAFVVTNLAVFSSGRLSR